MLSRTGNNFAFTLLELLVAMALMAVVSAALYGSLYIGFKARESSEGAIQPIRAACIVMEMLEQDIAAALPPTGILAGGFLGVDEKDGSGYDFDSLTFYCSNHKPAEQEKACDIRKMELALTESADSDGYILVRRITTNLLSPRSIEPVEQVMYRGVKAMNLEYCDGFEWLEEWDSTAHNDALPKAVKVNIEIQCPAGDVAGQSLSGLDQDGSTYRLTHAFVVPCNGSMQQGQGGAQTREE